MTDQSIEQKMMHLIPHWAEHMNSHADEFVYWSKVAPMDPEVVAALADAEKAMRAAGEALDRALGVLTDHQTKVSEGGH